MASWGSLGAHLQDRQSSEGYCRDFLGFWGLGFRGSITKTPKLFQTSWPTGVFCDCTSFEVVAGSCTSSAGMTVRGSLQEFSSPVQNRSFGSPKLLGSASYSRSPVPRSTHWGAWRKVTSSSSPVTTQAMASMTTTRESAFGSRPSCRRITQGFAAFSFCPSPETQTLRAK